MGVGTTLVLTGYLRKYEGVFTLKSMQKKLQDALIKIFPYCCKIQALSYIEKNRSSSIKIRRVTVVFFLNNAKAANQLNLGLQNWIVSVYGY